MLTFVGEWVHWLSLSWRRRKKVGRPATALELLNSDEKRTWSLAELQELKTRRPQVLADEAEAGMCNADVMAYYAQMSASYKAEYDELNSNGTFPWDRRRADDE